MRRVIQLQANSKKKNKKTNNQQFINHGNENISFLFWVLFFSHIFCRKTLILQITSVRASGRGVLDLALTLFVTGTYSILK